MRVAEPTEWTYLALRVCTRVDLNGISTGDSIISKGNPHQTVHIQVKTIELNTVRVRVSHVDRNSNFVAFLIGYLDLFTLYNRKNLER